MSSFEEALNEWDGLEVKKDVSTAELDQLIKEMLGARDDYETAKKISNEADEKHKALKAKVLAIMNQIGKSKYHVDGVGSITKVTSWKVQVPKEPTKKAAFFAYLKERGVFDELVGVNYQTLNAFYNEEMNTAPGSTIPGIDMPIADETIRFNKEKK